MLDLIKQCWHSFKTAPDVWFFYLFLITSTLTVRKVLFFYPINNSFNEYAGAYIYLSDIFLILTFIFYILYNINYILSIIKVFLVNCSTKIKLFHACLSGRQVEQLQKKYNSNLNCSTPAPYNCSTWNNYKKILNNVSRLPRRMFHACPVVCSTWNITTGVEHSFWGGTFLLIKKTYTLITNNYLTIFPLFIAFFSFLSILWTINKPVAIFRSIKLFEFILLYFYIIRIVPRGTIQKCVKRISKISTKLFHLPTGQAGVEQFKNNQNEETIAEDKCSTWNILQTTLAIMLWTGLIQSIIGIVQFLKQSSVGLFWLKESLISPNISGVAKIILNGDAYIRAYGLFPHPNILGGFLTFSILISLLYIKMFHVEHSIVKKSNENCSTWNIICKNLYNGITNKSLSLRIAVFIQLIALSLTFSKSAIIGLLMGFLYITINTSTNNVPRGTLLKKIKTVIKMFHVEHFNKKVLLVALIILSLIIILKPDLNSLFIKSLNERELYLNVSRGTFLANPLLGIGSGQFVLNMSANYKVESWQYQPVHNVFLLIANEYGIFILLGFLFYLLQLFKTQNCSTPVVMFHPSSNVPRGTYYGAGVEHTTGQAWNNLKPADTKFAYLKGILLSVIFVMFFDHYFWDIQQGQMLLWMLFGFIVAEKNKLQI